MNINVSTFRILFHGPEAGKIRKRIAGLLVLPVIERIMIKSISYSQHEILSWIQKLYCPQGFDLDPTYGYGGFYKNHLQMKLCGDPEEVGRPRLYFDLNRSVDGAWKADARHLPIKSRSIESVIIDPPFLAGGGRSGVMVRKYGAAGGDENPMDVWKLYRDIMKECLRTLKPQGNLIVKCQDLLHGRTQYMTHIEITNYAIDLGMYPKDIFILLAKNRLRSWNHQIQNHSRKFHSYFLVFGKQKRTIGYSRPEKKRR